MIEEQIDEFASGSQSSPIDVHVGLRIRLLRKKLSLSQGALGEILGLTFQQVQKYERGANRVGASRLFEISRALGVSVNYFFDEMSEGLSKIPVSGPRGRMAMISDHYEEPLHAFRGDESVKDETVELVQAYYGIPKKDTRRRFFDLVKSLSELEETID